MTYLQVYLQVNKRPTSASPPPPNSPKLRRGRRWGKVSSFQYSVSSFQNAAGALATLDEGEGKLAWPERSGGNLGSSGDKTEDLETEEAREEGEER